jgi:peptide/nickel transport system permease protein
MAGGAATAGSRLAPAKPLAAVARWLGTSDGVTLACVTVLVILAVLAVFGPLIAPSDPSAVDLSNVLASPSGAHPFGTDGSGRDILSRIIVGARPSLLGALVISLGATFIGTIVGLSSAWVGGWIDAAVSRTMDIVFAFPGLLLAMILVAIMGRGIVAPVVALTIANIPWVGRVVRSAALRERRLPYVQTCVVQGFAAPVTLARHVVPNISPTIFAQGALTFSYGMIDLLAINFLGLGVQPPTPDWGVLVGEGQDSVLRGSPEEALFASAFIVLTVVAVTVLSHRLGSDEGAADEGAVGVPA